MCPELTIIVPSYNNAAFLGMSIGSLSTKSSSVEIIVVDDGSSDNSPEVLAELARSHSNLRVIRQENGGVSRARNTGIREASGRFIMFVDADDRLLPNALDRISRCMRDYNTDIVVFRSFCKGREVEQWGEFFKENHCYTASDLMRGKYVRGSACGCMYRLDYLRNTGIVFCEDLSMAEDTVFFACAISAGASISFSALGLYETVLREGSASRSFDTTFLFRYGKALRAARRLISDHCVADNTILRILMGIVSFAAQAGYSSKETKEICAVESVLPLSVSHIANHKWLVKVLNSNFSMFFLIKKWRDLLLPSVYTFQ